jgi:hypothetical protein
MGENYGSHQFLNWWQQCATGTLRFDYSNLQTHCLKGKALILRAGRSRKPVDALALLGSGVFCLHATRPTAYPIIYYIRKTSVRQTFYQQSVIKVIEINDSKTTPKRENKMFCKTLLREINIFLAAAAASP